MIAVNVSYGNTHVRFPARWVIAVVRVAAKQQRLKGGVVGVRFVDNKEIRKLNKTYRKKNTPTDVLSFATDGRSGIDIGDIIISVDYVRGLPGLMRDQVGMLLIHGFLHCLGYEHKNRSDAKKMWNVQDVIAQKAGVYRIAFDDFG